MSMNFLIPRQAILNLRTFKNVPKCCYASDKGIVSELEVEEVPLYDEEAQYDTEQLDRIRDKSRLRPQDRNVLKGQKPYDQSHEYYHDTVWYRKRMLGRYGIEAAGVTPAIAWPTKKDIEDTKEYESLAYSVPIQDLWKQFEERKIEKAMEMRKREEEIDKVVVNFDKWRAALNAKVAKKEAELLEAKKRKERTMEEIREKFGFNIDPRDERFQEMLAQKEKEDKKRKKEEKKQKNAEKLLAYLAKQEEEMKAKEAAVKAGETNESEINEINNSKESGKKEEQ